MQTNLFLFGILMLTLIVLGIRLMVIEKKLKAFFGSKGARSAESLVYEHSDAIKALTEEGMASRRAIKDLDERFLLSIQKMGMVRFNPFSNTGGDQSFAIALLDGNNDGFVLSGLYLHGQPMVYAKPIEAGVARYTLSEEEQQALEKATHRE